MPAQPVATLKVYVDLENPEQYGEADRATKRHELFEFAARNQKVVEAQLRSSVTRHLGPAFDANVFLREGSVTVVAPIVLLGSAVATYGTVWQGLEYVRRDGERFVTALFSWVPQPVSVAAYYR